MAVAMLCYPEGHSIKKSTTVINIFSCPDVIFQKLMDELEKKRNLSEGLISPDSSANPVEAAMMQDKLKGLEAKMAQKKVE